MGEKRKEGRKKEKRERKMRREKLYLLSIISGDRSVVSRRSKRQSSSMRQGLRIETKIWGFRQALRGRGFSPTWFNSSLKAIQMVEIVGAGTAVHFSPKDLGLNAGFSGLFSNSPELNLRDYF